MYCIKKVKIPKNKREKLKLKERMEIKGFLMPSKQNKFKINNSNVSNIVVVNKKLARPLVTKKVSKKYKKLILLLTELLITDDDTGEALREALNQIEKFRQEIKNKYRTYLSKKELEKMSKQLKLLQLEAKTRFIELQVTYNNTMNRNGKSR